MEGKRFFSSWANILYTIAFASYIATTITRLIGYVSPMWGQMMSDIFLVSLDIATVAAFAMFTILYIHYLRQGQRADKKQGGEDLESIKKDLKKVKRELRNLRKDLANMGR